jgi:hypothetical protein
MIGSVLGHWLLPPPHIAGTIAAGVSGGIAHSRRVVLAFRSRWVQRLADAAETGYPVASQGDGVNAHLCSA